MIKYETSELLKVFEYLKKNSTDMTIFINADPIYGITFKFENKDGNLVEIKLFPEEIRSFAQIIETKRL